MRCRIKDRDTFCTGNNSHANHPQMHLSGSCQKRLNDAYEEKLIKTVRGVGYALRASM